MTPALRVPPAGSCISFMPSSSYLCVGSDSPKISAGPKKNFKENILDAVSEHTC